MDQNRHRIAFLNGPEGLGAAQERLQLFRRIAEERQIVVTNDLLRFTNLQSADVRIQMEALLALPERPQAVFTFNDYVAMDAMQACKKAGLIPNQDIAFVSFANLPITFYLDNPPLASIEQFAYEMGEKAAQLLLEVQKYEGKICKELLVSTQLVIH